ncbi:methyltransferase [Cyanobacterium sp. IPPAS B-1200]|uniref:methyltransferase n=1 Tax=Cyanobacterium sp. IPPAS B-1200 TaxID=1562720 RepID=UPI0008528604|nr:methyltransferase [Cyanobacterium sp. IPPAS B-1200]OEJ79944.1 methyltransferase [Cyanobacterium sp. IPPAS B-1200]
MIINPTKEAIKVYPSDSVSQEIFFCPEESLFYAQCLEKMVLNVEQDFTSVIEFGAGDGTPVINCLLKKEFNGFINGYELNSEACEVARFRIERHNLNRKYVVHNTCFFKNRKFKDNCLISNPPYLPAVDNNIYLPSLHGGIDGSSITKRLLSLDCHSAMLMISAYSDPVGIIEYAIAQGYQVDDFIASPMSFGYYSSEPKVSQRITELHRHYKAFYSPNIYILAGVLFKKCHNLKADLSTELIKIMTAL